MLLGGTIKGSLAVGVLGLVNIVFRLQDDGPAGWEGGMVGVEVVGLEKEAAKDGGYG